LHFKIDILLSGGIIYPFMIPKLVNETSFAQAVRWIALLQGILLCIANCLVSSPFPPGTFDSMPKPKHANESEDKINTQPSPQVTEHGHHGEHANTREDSDTQKQSITNDLLSLPWVTFIVGCFLVMLTVFAPLNYLPEMAYASGMSFSLAQHTVAVAK
jgi:MFS transporter, MCT family, solute carrier family 16 (monocarboxylic acid transporters), member 10